MVRGKNKCACAVKIQDGQQLLIESNREEGDKNHEGNHQGRYQGSKHRLIEDAIGANQQRVNQGNATNLAAM